MIYKQKKAGDIFILLIEKSINQAVARLAGTKSSSLVTMVVTGLELGEKGSEGLRVTAEGGGDRGKKESGDEKTLVNS